MIETESAPVGSNESSLGRLAVRQGRLNEQPRHEAERAGFQGFYAFDLQRFACDLGRGTFARNGGPRLSENGCPQRVEGGELGYEVVRSGQHSGYHRYLCKW